MKISDYPIEEQERRRALSRERNKRYLAKKDAGVAERRATASKKYREKLSSDPAYVDKLAETKRKAVIRTSRWQKENPELVKLHAKNVRDRNPAKQVEKTQRRNAAKLQSIPSWANHDAIARHYLNARYLTEVTGHLHHVDHIIPLRGKNVCGLHVENNLRAIPHFFNTRKGNKLEI